MLVNYRIATDDYFVEVFRDGTVTVDDGFGSLTMRLDEFEKIQEDIRALVHLRKAHGDWDGEIPSS